ncbi:MAG: DUF3568 family protein [Candidatus Rokuibacteriota bacterium]
MTARHRGIAFVMLTALLCQGCAAVGLTLFGVGAGVAAGTGTSYTLDGIAYRTFPEPAARVRTATLTALRSMDVTVNTDETMESGRRIVGQAGDRTIDIELAELTTRTTRMRVTARYSWILRDRATAGEIITQTEHSLDDLPAVSQKPVASQKAKEISR